MSLDKSLFWAAGAGMFVFGVTLAILGALFGLPQMRERLNVDLAQQGDIFLMLYFGIFVSTVIVGPIVDTFGNKTVLTTSAVFVVAGFLGCWVVWRGDGLRLSPWFRRRRPQHCLQRVGG